MGSSLERPDESERSGAERSVEVVERLDTGAFFGVGPPKKALSENQERKMSVTYVAVSKLGEPSTDGVLVEDLVNSNTKNARKAALEKAVNLWQEGKIFSS